MEGALDEIGTGLDRVRNEVKDAVSSLDDIDSTISDRMDRLHDDLQELKDVLLDVRHVLAAHVFSGNTGSEARHRYKRILEDKDENTTGEKKSKV